MFVNDVGIGNWDVNVAVCPRFRDDPLLEIGTSVPHFREDSMRKLTIPPSAEMRKCKFPALLIADEKERGEDSSHSSRPSLRVGSDALIEIPGWRVSRTARPLILRLVNPTRNEI